MTMMLDRVIAITFLSAGIIACVFIIGIFAQAIQEVNQ